MKNTKNHITPPRLAEKLLLWFLKDELAEEVMGDLDEKFYRTAEKKSIIKARRNYWYQVFNYARPFALKSTKIKRVIISPMNIHFKFAARIFRKNSLITFASLTSMVVGVLSTFLIYSWVNSELTTDQFHSNYDKIYLLTYQQSPVDHMDVISSDGLFNIDYSKYSEIDQSLQTHFYSPDRIKLKYNNKEYRGNGLIADSTFFDLFDFKLIDGNKSEILKTPSNIIITKSYAKRIFGDTNPIGETIDLECDQIGTYQIAGILDDIPSNSTLFFDFLVPKHSQQYWLTSGIDFILTNESFNHTEFNEEIEKLGRSHPQFTESMLSTVSFTDIYFNNTYGSDLLAKYGDMTEINTMLTVGLVILIVSVLNFTNMQSTLIFSQLKTKGIKQIHGAGRIDFLLELTVSRLIYTFVSILLIFGLFCLIKPTYLSFLSLTLDKSWLEILQLITVGTFLFIFLTTSIALLRSTKVSSPKALMGQTAKERRSYAGKVFTTIQYVFAIALIIASGVVFKQFQYMQNKDLGYNPENLVSIKFFDRVPFTGDMEKFQKQSEEQIKNYDYVRNELRKIPGVNSFSQGDLPLDKTTHAGDWKPTNSEDDFSNVKVIRVEPSYAETLGLSMHNGRFYTDSIDLETQKKVVINKAAMEYWNIEDLDETTLKDRMGGRGKDPYQIIGVVNNFHYEHLSQKIQPLVILFIQLTDSDFILRVSKDRFKPTMEAVAELFQTANPNQDFTYTVLQDRINAQYEREKKLSRTFMFFTLIALILSSIGLFTMALYETQKRIKEIGIRKVIGASVGQVVALLSSNFVKWVLLAFIIASPIAWYAMNEWLANFANQTSLSWWIFAAAGMFTMILAMATVIGQSLTAARRNPVHSLRHE